jgi:putative tricarboxylic transport membrane protein
MRETPAWQSILDRNEWEDSFLVGDEFRSFLRDERRRAEEILTDLEFGSGGAGYAAIGAWTFPTLIMSVLVLSSVLVLRTRSGDVLPPGGIEPVNEGEPDWSKVAATVGVLFVFPWAMDVLGYHVATVLLLVVLARVFGSRRFVKELIFGATLAVGSFVLFDKLLGVGLPMGPFAGLI